MFNHILFGDQNNFFSFFRLYTFPTVKKDPKKRYRWQQLINRVSKDDNNQLWSPSKDCRVCSEHFIDGQPTLKNPYPTLKLGYPGFEDRVRRMLYFPTPNSCAANLIPIEIQIDGAHHEPMVIEDPPVETVKQEKPQIPWYMTLIALFLTLINKLTTFSTTNMNLRIKLEDCQAEIKRLKSKKYVETF